MRKLTQAAWNHLGEDYKMIKNGVKYAMVDGCILEPIEIDNEKGEYMVKVTFKCPSDNIISEQLLYYYDPTKPMEESFKKAIQKVIHYDEYYKYFVDNGQYKILSVEVFD